MSKFNIRKRLSLSFLGEGWQECYIEASPLSPSDLKVILSKPAATEQTPETALENINDSSTRLKEHFVSGKGLVGDKIVDLTAGDLDDLPLEVTSKLTSLLTGEIDPNSQALSTS